MEEFRTQHMISSSHARAKQVIQTQMNNAKHKTVQSLPRNRIRWTEAKQSP